MGSCELRRLISQKTRNEAFVKNKAELVGLAANARIGEEIKLISKANKHQSPMAGKLTNGVQLGRKPTLTHHQGDACARGGVLAGHIVGKNPGKVMA
jgi:hypothetical protein